MPKDIFKKDPYSILGVAGDATDKEIYSVYRKKALKCHPDKNPDNPKAAELFHELSKALEILTNVAARAAYDQTIKAKRASEERNKVLDSKRKKFKEDLEARERAFQKQTQKKREAAEKKYRQQEKERLEATSRPEKQDWQRYHQLIELHQLCVEERRLREEERRQRELARQVEVAQWKAQNEGYTMDTLNKSGSEYTESAAEIDRDFETLVLMKMRQAGERNRLIIE